MEKKRRTEIAELGEFGLIDLLTKGFDPADASTLRAAGDDTLRWQTANRLFDSYITYNIDTTMRRSSCRRPARRCSVRRTHCWRA